MPSVHLRKAILNCGLHLLALAYTFTFLSPASCNESPFQENVSCLPDEEGFALFDGRNNVTIVDRHRQCRVPCKTFSNPHISISQISTNCSFWRDPVVNQFRNLLSNNTCIPRGICIKGCEKEKPGCVYSGSCTSQTCFTSNATGKPANLTRVTYEGPRSYVTTDEGSTKVNPAQPRVFRGEDRCQRFRDQSHGTLLTISRIATDCDPNSPFSDDRLEGTFKRQCRSICANFSDDRVEIVKIRSACRLCKRRGFETYLTATRPVCVPSEECKRACGDPPLGCVYTGTCKVQFCLSGIDSKKPVAIDLGDDLGNTISLTVDNDGEPITIDPPAFASLPLSIDYDGPTPTPESSPSPSPSPIFVQSVKPSPTPNSTSLAPAATSGEASRGDDASDSHWTWLGPLCGLIGAAVIGFLGTVFAAVIRNRASHGDQSTVEETAANMDM